MRYLSLCAALLAAASAARAADGYVVKVESAAVYLDLGAGSVSVGTAFDVLRPDGELKHPVTGESLGPLLEKSGSGRITQVEEKYSVGAMSEGRAEPGWRARPAAAPAPAPSQTPAAVRAPAAADGPHAPVVRSPFFPMEAVDVAVGDVDGDGAADAVLATSEKVEARRMSGDWGVLCAFQDTTTGSRVISVEARDLDGDGRAEVFVVTHNRLAAAVETHVLDCKGGALVKRETLPWIVRSYGTEAGARALAAQRLEPDSNFPASDVQPFVYEGGKYKMAKPAFKHKRLEWIYGFAFAPAVNGATLIQYNQAKRLTLRFPKGSWTTPEAYGFGTGNLQWHGTEFHFHPRLFASIAGGELKAVYSVRNIPKLVSLAASMGLYGGAELARLSFNGLALEPSWKADLSGTAAGLDLVPASGGAPERLAVAVVGSNGLTAVWLFDE